MLAARLGVALIVILVLSSYVTSRDLSGMTPTVHVTAEPEHGDTIRIAGIEITPRRDSREELETKLSGLSADDLEEVREGLEELESLGEWGVIASAALQAALREEMALAEASLEQAERERAAFLAEQEAMKAAGAEIAEAFTAGEAQDEEALPEDVPDRLSEDEIQALVVERLLSVQTSTLDTGSADEASAAPQIGQDTMPEPALPDAPSEAVDVAPPPPVAPAASGSLERVEGDFAGQNLMGRDFRGQDLSEIDFSNAKLTAAKFDGSDLSEADFTGARLQGASFAGAILEGASLANAQAQTANFLNANLREADLTQANLAGADLTRADLRGATMDELNLNGAVMIETKLGD